MMPLSPEGLALLGQRAYMLWLHPTIYLEREELDHESVNL